MIIKVHPVKKRRTGTMMMVTMMKTMMMMVMVMMMMKVRVMMMLMMKVMMLMMMMLMMMMMMMMMMMKVKKMMVIEVMTTMRVTIFCLSYTLYFVCDQTASIIGHGFGRRKQRRRREPEFVPNSGEETSRTSPSSPSQRR